MKKIIPTLFNKVSLLKKYSAILLVLVFLLIISSCTNDSNLSLRVTIANEDDYTISVTNRILSYGVAAKIQQYGSAKRSLYGDDAQWQIKDTSIAKFLPDNDLIGLKVGETEVCASGEYEGKLYSDCAKLRVVAPEKNSMFVYYTKPESDRVPIEINYEIISFSVNGLPTTFTMVLGDTTKTLPYQTGSITLNKTGFFTPKVTAYFGNNQSSVTHEITLRTAWFFYGDSGNTSTPTTPTSRCCKVCSTGKPCGDSCISRSYTCNKGGGCACSMADIPEPQLLQLVKEKPEILFCEVDLNNEEACYIPALDQ